MWQQWILAVIGFWIIALGFIGINGIALTGALVITGITVVILAIGGAFEKKFDPSTRPMTEHDRLVLYV